MELEKITVVLRISLIPDRQKGVLIGDLKKGTRVLVKIVDSRDIAQYLATLLGGKQGSEIVSFPAPVEEIKVDELGKYTVITRFGPGVLGKTICEENVKIKLAKKRRGLFSLITKLLKRRGE